MTGMSRDEFLAMSWRWQREQMEARLEDMYDHNDRDREIASWPRDVMEIRYRNRRARAEVRAARDA